jgi:IMP dehydrogenase
VADIDIGMGKSARRAFGLDELTILPSRRTRDADLVDLSWQLDAYSFDLPILASAMDSVVSPATAIELARCGGLGVLNLEGLWTRHAEVDPLLEELATLEGDAALGRLRELSGVPIDPDLVTQRISELRAGGALAVGAVSPKRVAGLIGLLRRAELDLLVIRGTVVSAEHVTRNGEPLNLKQFVRELDLPVVVGGCASYQAALHLMRTGRPPCWSASTAASPPPPVRSPVWAPPSPPPSPTCVPPACDTSTRPGSTCTSSPTAASAPVPTSPRPSPAVPTR